MDWPLWIAVAIGASLCAIAIDIMVTTFRCRERVSAVMVDYGFEQYKAHITSSPIFVYHYEGRDYQEKAAECLSQRYVLKHYKKGETYPIYLSKKEPRFFKITRRIHAFEATLLAIGLAVVAVAVVGIFC